MLVEQAANLSKMRWFSFSECPFYSPLVAVQAAGQDGVGTVLSDKA